MHTLEELKNLTESILSLIKSKNVNDLQIAKELILKNCKKFKDEEITKIIEEYISKDTEWDKDDFLVKIKRKRKNFKILDFYD